MDEARVTDEIGGSVQDWCLPQDQCISNEVTAVLHWAINMIYKA